MLRNQVGKLLRGRDASTVTETQPPALDDDGGHRSGGGALAAWPLSFGWTVRSVATAAEWDNQHYFLAKNGHV